jgi:hypothetical protein
MVVLQLDRINGRLIQMDSINTQCSQYKSIQSIQMKTMKTMNTVNTIILSHVSRTVRFSWPQSSAHSAHSAHNSHNSHNSSQYHRPRPDHRDITTHDILYTEVTAFTGVLCVCRILSQMPLSVFSAVLCIFCIMPLLSPFSFLYSLLYSLL